MHKFILVVLLCSLPVLAPAGIEPDTTTAVTVSNIDVNRFVCPYDVEDIIYSTEKGLTAKVSGKNVFIKLPVTVKSKGGIEIGKQYYTGTSEMFLVCGGNVYSLILEPKKIAAQTVYLSDTRGSIKKAMNYVKSTTYDETLLKLIDDVIKDNIPVGFGIKKVTGEKVQYKNIEVTLSRVIHGAGFKVKEMILYSPTQVSMMNTELLSMPWIENPRAATVLEPTFHGITKGFVVEVINGQN